MENITAKALPVYHFADFKLDERLITPNNLLVVIPGNKDAKRLISQIQENLRGLEDLVALEVDNKNNVKITKNEKGEAQVKLFFSNYTAPVAQFKFGQESDYVSPQKTAQPQELKKYIFNSTFYTRDSSEFIINNDEKEPKTISEKEKLKSFIDTCGAYYQSPNLSYELFSKSKHHKLVVGEDHENSDAVDFIIALLPELKKSETPIFLEFLEWEIHHNLLEKYHRSAPGSTEEKLLEGLVKVAIEGLPRRFNHGREGENNDLFTLIKEAKKYGVRVISGESIVAFRTSSHDYYQFGGKRCHYSNYGTMEIIKSVSPDNFVVLFGNAHLLNNKEEISREERSKRKIAPKCGLQEMMNAEAVSFSRQNIAEMKKSAPNIECFRTFDESRPHISRIIERFNHDDVRELLENTSSNAAKQPLAQSTKGAKAQNIGGKTNPLSGSRSADT